MRWAGPRCWSYCTRLAEADSLATGPGVWGDWKASLIGDLVRRCRLVMSGEPLPQPDPIDPRYLSLASRSVYVELTPVTARTSTTSR